MLGYLGAFGRVNRVDVIVEAAAVAETAGPGPDRRRADRRRPGAAGGRAPGGRRCPAVAFGPAVPKRFVPMLLRALDATVVHTTYTPVYRYGISFNKLFEYMAAERPVVFACDSAYDPVAATGAGHHGPARRPGAASPTPSSSWPRATPEARAAMGCGRTRLRRPGAQLRAARRDAQRGRRGPAARPGTGRSAGRRPVRSRRSLRGRPPEARPCLSAWPRWLGSRETPP